MKESLLPRNEADQCSGNGPAAEGTPAGPQFMERKTALRGGATAPPKARKTVGRQATANSPHMEKEVPLYLLPQAVARLIRQKGDAVYRISVVRTHHHHYNVRVRTNTVRRELRPVRNVTIKAVPDAGPAPNTPVRGRRRECAA